CAAVVRFGFRSLCDILFFAEDPRPFSLDFSPSFRRLFLSLWTSIGFLNFIAFFIYQSTFGYFFRIGFAYSTEFYCLPFSRINKFIRVDPIFGLPNQIFNKF
ncbi:hypothetical protein EBX31_10325, partial [bacterium]|nr:hypothetical protein [bacterium]